MILAHDVELRSLVSQVREESPYCGISMLWGSIRSRGIKVTRERVRQAVKSIDPLGGALRWPTLIKRRPYSVGGPNSLWHIGEFLLGIWMMYSLYFYIWVYIIMCSYNIYIIIMTISPLNRFTS